MKQKTKQTAQICSQQQFLSDSTDIEQGNNLSEIKLIPRNSSTRIYWEILNFKSHFYSLFVQQTNSNQLQCLDGIRSLSFMLVITYHLMFNWTGGERHLNELLYRIFFNGHLGVDSFFVLSGWLNFMTMYQELSKHQKADNRDKIFLPSSKRFYIRRFLRITPAYYVALLVYYITTCYYNWVKWKQDCEQYYWSNILFYNNYYPKFDDQCMNWSWTIAIEIQMYLITPILAYIVFKDKNKGSWLISLLVICSIITNYLWFIYIRAWKDNWNTPFFPQKYKEQIYVNMFCRMNCYLLGMLGCILFQSTKLQASNNYQGYLVFALNVLIMFLVVYWGTGYTYSQDSLWIVLYQTLNRSLWSLQLVCIILLCIWNQIPLINYILSSRFLYAIAQLSYSGYLYHFTIILITGHIVQRDYCCLIQGKFLRLFLLFIFVTFISLTLSMISYVIIEKPFMLIARKITSDSLLDSKPSSHKSKYFNR